MIQKREELVIVSQMDGNGQIFSDWIEYEFIEFNSGSIAAFRVSEQQSRLVVKEKVCLFEMSAHFNDSIAATN